MLNELRSLAGGFWAKTLLLLLVISFSVWGVGDVLRNSGRNPTIATIGSVEISAQEFMRAMHQETENLRRVMGENYSPDLLKNMNLSHWVLQKLINNALMKQEAEAIGLIPSDSDVVKRIRSNIDFQDAKGNFDKNIFEARLRNIGLSEKIYVEKLREDVGIGMLVDTIIAKIPVSDMQVRTLLEAQEEQRAVTLYVLSPMLVKNAPQPDDTQIKAYYDAHAREFTAPEYRTLSYVSITNADVPKDSQNSEEALRAMYNDRIEDFKRPELRTVEQLLFDSQEKADAAEAMLKSGKSFAQVAKSVYILNKDSVSMGQIERKALFANAEDKVFTLAKDGYTDPIQSPFGWHIFHVSAIQPQTTQSFETVRPQLEKEIKQQGSEQGLNKLANRFEDALAGGSTFAEAAHEHGLKLLSVGPINHQGLSPDGNASKAIPNFDKFLDVAFKAEEKSESPMTAAKGGIFYIVHVDSVTPEHLNPLDEVKARVIAGYQKEEREKRLAVLASEIAGKFANPSDREAVIAKYDLQPVSVANIKRTSHAIYDNPLPPAMLSDIFSHKPHEGTHAYPGKDGNYLIAEINAIIPAIAPEKDTRLRNEKTELRKQLESTTQNEILQQYADLLAKKYPVSINETALQAVLK